MGSQGATDWVSEPQDRHFMAELFILVHRWLFIPLYNSNWSPWFTTRKKPITVFIVIASTPIFLVYIRSSHHLRTRSYPIHQVVKLYPIIHNTSQKETKSPCNPKKILQTTIPIVSLWYPMVYPPLFRPGWDFIQHMPEHIAYLLRQSDAEEDAERAQTAATAATARGSQRHLLWGRLQSRPVCRASSRQSFMWFLFFCDFAHVLWFFFGRKNCRKPWKDEVFQGGIHDDFPLISIFPTFFCLNSCILIPSLFLGNNVVHWETESDMS